MANVDAPKGLRPIRHLTGGCVTRMEAYTLASGHTESIFLGDPVSLSGTGRQVQLTAATGTDSVGTFEGVSYTDAKGAHTYSRYWPANTVATNVIVLVNTDPEAIFIAQIATLAAADIGSTVDFVLAAGDPKTGYSGSSLAAVATPDGTEPIKLIGLADVEGNEYGANAKVECVYNKHAFIR